MTLAWPGERGRLLVADSSGDDLPPDMAEVLTTLCIRRCGRRAAPGWAAGEQPLTSSG
jgi:predicted site-specific integrase-resolvase